MYIHLTNTELFLYRKACEAWKVLLKKKYLEQRLIDNRDIWQLLTMKSKFSQRFPPVFFHFLIPSTLRGSNRMRLIGFLLTEVDKTSHIRFVFFVYFIDLTHLQEYSGHGDNRSEKSTLRMTRCSEQELF